MKTQSRAMGIATAKVRFASSEEDHVNQTSLVGVIQRGKSLIEGIVKTAVVIDSIDITDSVIDLTNSSDKKMARISVVFSSSVFLAGFSVFDLKRFTKTTGIPALAILRKEPSMNDIENAITGHFADADARMNLLRKQGTVKPLYNGLYFQSPSLSRKESSDIIEPFLLSSKIPECLRLASMICKIL
ncbi:MAG: endonuclease dU [Candidatus Hodarchaeales archaeon]